MNTCACCPNPFETLALFRGFEYSGTRGAEVTQLTHQALLFLIPGLAINGLAD